MYAWRARIGLIHPTHRGKTFALWYKHAPEGVEIVPTFIGFRQSTTDTFAAGIQRAEELADDLKSARDLTAGVGQRLLHRLRWSDLRRPFPATKLPGDAAELRRNLHPLPERLRVAGLSGNTCPTGPRLLSAGR